MNAPNILSPRFDTMPYIFTARPQWLGAQVRVKPDGGLDKPPCRLDGRIADAHNPENWSSFEDVRAACLAGVFPIVGYDLSKADDITGIDLDHCRDTRTGEIAAWARTVVARMRSYTEATCSGSGLRILVAGLLPDKDNKIGDVEMYCNRRYFVMTGQHLAGTPTTIEDRQAELLAFHAETFAERIAERARQADRLRARGTDYGSPVLADDTIIELAGHAKNGDKFRALYYSGDVSGYSGDDSSADLALASLLVFYTQDYSQVYRLIRQSALYRRKWDRADYAERTIQKALDGANETYRPYTKSGYLRHTQIVVEVGL